MKDSLKMTSIKLNLFLILLIIFPQAYAQQSCQNLFDHPISHFSKIIEFDQNQSWSKQIFEKEIDKVFTLFAEVQALETEEKVKRLNNSDIRLSLLKLQSLSRTAGLQNSKYFEKIRIYFKEIEGGLVAIDLAKTLLKESRTLNENVVEEKFQQQLYEAYEKFEQTISLSGLDQNIIENLQALKADLAKKANWQFGRDERKMLIYQLSQRALQLHKDIVKRKYSEDDIEKGFHKLRLEIRWLVVQVSSLDGLVMVYNEKDLTNKLENLYYQLFKYNPQLFENKYIQLSKPQIDQPIKIPRVEWAMIADYALQMGNIKDEIEHELYLKEAVKQSSLPKSQRKALKKVIEGNTKITVDSKQLAERVQAELEKTELLKHYADHLKQMND